MLTYDQCQVVAFTLNGAIICPDCAAKATSTVTVAKAEQGLTTGDDLTPLIRYSLDEYNGERAGEHADEEVGDWTQENASEWQKVFDDYPSECCEDCGTELS